MTRLHLSLACLLSGLAAAACASIAPDRAYASELDGTRWQLINGAPALAQHAPELSFGPEGRLTGSGGCNALFAVYEIADGVIDVRGIGRTERACETQVMRAEESFVELLSQATRYRREGDRLVLSAGNGRDLVFSAAG